MSRIGKMPIAVPAGVDVKVDGHTVTVKGPKGDRRPTFPAGGGFERVDASLTVTRADDSQTARALHGLSRSLLANMVTGVTTGYAKDLEISGTGYRAAVAGKKLNLSLGFSHPVEIDPPAGITFT